MGEREEGREREEASGRWERVEEGGRRVTEGRKEKRKGSHTFNGLQQHPLLSQSCWDIKPAQYTNVCRHWGSINKSPKSSRPVFSEVQPTTVRTWGIWVASCTSVRRLVKTVWLILCACVSAR